MLVRFCRGQRTRPQDFQITAVCHLGRELQVKGVRAVSQMPGFPAKLKVFEQITGAGLILPLRGLACGTFCARRFSDALSVFLTWWKGSSQINFPGFSL